MFPNGFRYIWRTRSGLETELQIRHKKLKHFSCGSKSSPTEMTIYHRCWRTRSEPDVEISIFPYAIVMLARLYGMHARLFCAGASCCSRVLLSSLHSSFPLISSRAPVQAVLLSSLPDTQFPSIACPLLQKNGEPLFRRLRFTYEYSHTNSYCCSVCSLNAQCVSII